MRLETPSNFDQIKTVAKYEFLKYVRGKNTPVMLAMGVAIPLLLVFLPEFFDAPDPEDREFYISALLGPIFFIQVIAVAFFGSGAIVSEFRDKTGFALFPNPINRTSIWFGKFIAAEIASFLVIAVYYVVISSATLYKFNELPNEIIFSLLFSFLITSSLLCITFLASSTFRSPTSALVIIILLFIIILPMVDQFLIALAEIKPWFTPSFSSGVITNILKVPYPIDLEESRLPLGPFDSARFVPYVAESILVLFLYLVVCATSSIAIFRRMEMK
jgi:ABC-type transport system involved in multi-copper enzyme maturation permease subunit